jgi:hypothetical protein
MKPAIVVKEAIGVPLAIWARGLRRVAGEYVLAARRQLVSAGPV